MGTTDFFLSFLQKKLENFPFQVWRYDHNKNEKLLLYLHGGWRPVSPDFHVRDQEKVPYIIEKKNNFMSLSFYYPEGDQIKVFIYHHSLVLSKEEVEYLYYFSYLSLLEETIQMKDKELTNLINSFHSVTSSLDVDEVLENIIKNALKVIPAADAGYLLLYDPTIKRLVPKAPVGFNEKIYNFRVKVGESVTGKVFEDGIGRIFNSKEEFFNAMYKNNISRENYHTIISSAHTPRAAICVPISIQDNRIGVMIIHQWYKKKQFAKHDLKLLQGFASQAAIVIQNARYYAEANQRLLEVTELSKKLQERNTQLQKRYEIHDKLTNISLQNKGIETIIYEFNQMIEYPVSFFNVVENKFYGNDKRYPPFSNIEMKKIFSTKRNPTHVEIVDSTVQNYYLYPIYNGTVFHGCLIVHVKDVISESDKMTLEHGSSILALELVKKQTITELFYKKTHEQFESLLNCQDQEELENKAKEIGLNHSAFWFLCIFEIPYRTDFQLLETEIHQLVLKIKHELFSQEKLIYGFHNKVILLISAIADNEVNEIIQTIHLIYKDWTNNEHPPFRGGISSYYKGLENIKKCYEEATKTLTYLSNREETTILRYEEMGLNRLFLNQPSQEIEQFIVEVFSPLWADREKYSELEETLLTYIENNRSAKKTAKKLHIHINTLYQRMRKIEDILQLDLNNHEDYLKIQLAYHLRENYYKLEI